VAEVQRLARGPAARVEVERLAALVRAQQLAEVAVAEEEAAPQEAVRAPARQALDARDQVLRNAAAAEGDDQLVVVDAALGADLPRRDRLALAAGLGGGLVVRGGGRAAGRLDAAAAGFWPPAGAAAAPAAPPAAASALPPSAAFFFSGSFGLMASTSSKDGPAKPEAAGAGAKADSGASAAPVAAATHGDGAEAEAASPAAPAPPGETVKVSSSFCLANLAPVIVSTPTPAVVASRRRGASSHRPA